VRQLVELHGGRVEAASAGPGKGSAFTVRLPCATRVEIEGADPSHAGATPCRILVIEDNDDAREMLTALLTLERHAVYMASDGPGGVDAALRLRPDVALIDIGLPGLDGYEVARRIRAAAPAHAIKLVALTGYGQGGDVLRAREAGFDLHLVKPVEPVRLDDALRTLLATGSRPGGV
jgi:CheY-like chemotaxis protein